MMAQTEAKLRLTRRWFFAPALLTIVLLGRIGILRDEHRAAKWLADHAMTIEVA